jgi:ABC-type branched-subunit amino acid transport system substrate-binding protein
MKVEGVGKMNVYKCVATSTVAVAALCTLSACGSGDSAAGGGTVTGKTVKIGTSVPLSGPTATAGTATKCGVQAALETANKEGGVNGYTFEVVNKDNQYDPGIAASIARDFASDGVFATVVAGTSTMEATNQVLEPRGIPVFGSPDGSAMSPPKWKGTFGYNAEYSREGASAATFIHDTLTQTKASAVYLNPAAKPAAQSFESTFEAAGGTVAANESLAPDVTDFAGIAQKLSSAGAPVVYATLVDTQLAGLQKAAAAIGYAPQWVAWNIAQGPAYLDLVGGLAEGVYFSQWATPSSETTDPAVQKYHAAVNALPECANLIGDNATKAGYAIGSVIGYAIEQATAGGKELTSDVAIDALSNVNDMQFGLTPHMSYDAESHAGVRENSYWQVKAGVLTMIRDFEPLPSS